jgi:hypothetical protein
MKLMTKDLEKKMPKPSSTEKDEDPICQVKYFNPAGRGNWFGIEYDPKTRTFFGYASIFGDHNDELGYFSLDELESFKGPFGMGIERDLYFKPQPLSEIKARYTRGYNE